MLPLQPKGTKMLQDMHKGNRFQVQRATEPSGGNVCFPCALVQGLANRSPWAGRQDTCFCRAYELRMVYTFQDSRGDSKEEYFMTCESCIASSLGTQTCIHATGMEHSNCNRGHTTHKATNI